MPPFRTSKYAIWKACERFNILPPDSKNHWDENDVDTQAHLIAYSQIRDYEEQKEREELYRFLGAKMAM